MAVFRLLPNVVAWAGLTASSGTLMLHESVMTCDPVLAQAAAPSLTIPGIDWTNLTALGALIIVLGFIVMKILPAHWTVMADMVQKSSELNAHVAKDAADKAAEVARDVSEKSDKTASSYITNTESIARLFSDSMKEMHNTHLVALEKAFARLELMADAQRETIKFCSIQRPHDKDKS